MRPTSMETLLAETLGFDPSALGVGHLRRGIQRRMTALGLTNETEYARHFEHSPTERQALFEELVVTETWFFRDGRPFEFLRRFARAWLESSDRPPLRVLSIPCSTGEEPYSIALTLLDLGLDPRRFRIDAVDVSAKALDHARRGVYLAKAIRELNDQKRKQFFRELPRGFELVESVRHVVRFRQGNLLEPGFLDSEPPYDVVFCRNLLIYLTGLARQQALATFERLLAPTGLLFVGYAETAALLEGPFALVPDRGAFAFRHRDAPPRPEGRGGELDAPRPPRALPSRGSPGPPSVRSHPAGRKSQRTAEGGDATTAGRPPSAGAVSQDTPDQPVPSSAEPRIPQGQSPPTDGSEEALRQAAALADQGRYDEAIEHCEQFLLQKGPSAPAYYLLGMIQQAIGRHEAAESTLTRAVYLDNQHEDALVALAMLAQRRGDSPASRRFHRRAERARQLNTSSSSSSQQVQ